MLADDMRRLAEEIAGAYEERVRDIADVKAETTEKLAGFRADLEVSNRERAERVQAELKEMGDRLRSDLMSFKSGLARFKDELDDAENGRKEEARAEISERVRHIANLRSDTLNLVNGFEDARKEMMRNLKSDLIDFTSSLANFRVDLADANEERVEMIRGELKEMGDRLRSDLKGFMSLLAQFKADLDKAEGIRKEEALAEIVERGRDVAAVLEGTRDLLKDFGMSRQEMWSNLKSQLDAFASSLAQFKADLDDAERGRKAEAQAEISERTDYIGNLRESTLDMIDAFEDARKEMWSDMKSQLEAFTSSLAQFKAELEQAETERQETIGQELREKADELRATLTGFTSGLSANVAGIMGELKKDRSEAARTWNQILFAMRSSRGEKPVVPPSETKAAVEKETVPDVVEEIEEPVQETPPPTEEKTEIQPEPKIALEPETEAEVEPEEEIEEKSDERESLISEILGLLEDTPDGLRMVEIADILGIENWRSLIPVMKELLDEGDIIKEDSTYFIV